MVTVVALGQSQVGHVRIEVAFATATIMLRVGELNVARSLRDQITQIMESSFPDAISITTVTALRAGSPRIIPTALDHFGFRQVFNTCDPSEVAPIRRTLPVLNLADRLKHKGVCYGEDWEPQGSSYAAFVQ